MQTTVSATIFRAAAELRLGAGRLNGSGKPAYLSEPGLNGSSLLPTNYKPEQGRTNQADVPVLTKGGEERHVKYKGLTVH